ncbi:MAG: hypothetical protein MUE65_02510 [Methanomassiliicoccales archaeon]|nr:hypothetical protein [Methanomassiliicoccales archaeon]
MQERPVSKGLEEDTIANDEIDFYMDAKRRLVQASLRSGPRLKNKPLLFVDLDRYFEDPDSMMA